MERKQRRKEKQTEPYERGKKCLGLNFQRVISFTSFQHVYYVWMYTHILYSLILKPRKLSMKTSTFLKEREREGRTKKYIEKESNIHRRTIIPPKIDLFPHKVVVNTK